MDEQRCRELKARIRALKDAGYDVSSLGWVARRLLWAKLPAILFRFLALVVCSYLVVAYQHARYSAIRALVAEQAYDLAMEKFEKWPSRVIVADKAEELKKEIVRGAFAKAERDRLARRENEAYVLEERMIRFAPEYVDLKKSIYTMRQELDKDRLRNEKAQRVALERRRADILDMVHSGY